MKRSTIHLSLPDGSTPPEAHVQVSPETLLFLATRASAGATSKTQIASMLLAANAAAASKGAADMTIDFRFLLANSALDDAIAAVRAETAAISSARIALTSTRVPSSPAAREERARLLDALSKALASSAATHAMLLAAAGLSPACLTAEVVTRALSQPAAAAPTAPVPARPPGIPKEDAEIILRNNLPRAHEHWQIWTICALAAAAAGREFTVPRPKAKPTPPAPTPPPAPASPASGAVDKLVTPATAKPEGQT